MSTVSPTSRYLPLLRPETSTGLSVHATLDEGEYPIGIQVSQEQFSSILIE
ncbi:MAG: hypothetical protein WA783_15195 [Phormidesmis sp.]